MKSLTESGGVEAASNPASSWLGGLAAAMGRFRENDRRDWACLLLVMVTFFVFMPVFSFDFILYDDPSYVTANSHVNGGLTRENVAWAVSTLHGGTSYWHPLTWLSHQLDCELFGLRPGAHHLTNLLLHIGAGLLLFLFLQRATGALGRSAAVAVLFCLHPLHVESVAWVAERKDVLSGLFWMATLVAYGAYADRPSGRRYLLVGMLFGLGLMSKPSVVTLPCVLLLLDFWPLRRLAPERPPGICGGGWKGLAMEKAPLFALTLASAAVTFIAQKNVGAMMPLSALPLADRVDNALVSYALYLGKAFWPANLSIIYSRLEGWPFAGVLAAGALLGAVSWLVVRQRRTASHLLTGWLWLLGTLVPMIGIVQVGPQSMADRYTYISLVGIFLMVVWSWPNWEGLSRTWWRASVAGAAGLLVVLCVTTRRQLNHWEGSVSVFRHAAEATGSSFWAEHNLGMALGNEKKFDEADRHFEKALALMPGSPVVNEQRGKVRLKAGRTAQAAECFEEVLRVDGRHLEAHLWLGLIRAAAPEQDLRDGAKAMEHARFVRQNSKVADARQYDVLAAALAETGRFDEAVGAAQRASMIAQAAAVPDDAIRRRLELYRAGKPYRALFSHPKDLY